MNTNELKKSIEENVRFVFARAGGNGGQNVNKVNTKVQAFLKLDAIAGLTEEERAQLNRRLRNSTNAAGEIFVSVTDERTQERNRAIALDRLFSQINAAAKLPKTRRKTKPTKASVEQRLKLKRLRSQLKRERNKWRIEN